MQGAVVHSNVIAAAERFLDVVQRIPDLRSKSLASHTINNVLILSFGEFSAPAKGLPKSKGWNVLCRFASHELF